MKNKTIFLILFITLIFISGLFLGRYYQSIFQENKIYIYPKLNKISTILNYISNDYVDSVSIQELEELAIRKILEELDPHSQYLTAEELQKANEPLEGNFSGIGVQFNMLNDTVIVIKTIPNGPSERVGILPGDRIVKVNEEIIAGKGLSTDSIVKKLRGPRGTKVKVYVQRKYVKNLLEFEIIRDNIPLTSLDIAYMITDKTGYIKITNFARNTFEEFINAYNDLKNKGIKNLILDLRQNGGGYMNVAINIADQFLAGNELIVYTEGRSRKREEFRSKPGGLCTDIKVAILIDEESASASEIVAGAIQDNDRGLIIGRRSFGKGLVQEQRQIFDGSAIRLTVARYYTPTGRCIQKPYNKNQDEYYNELFERFIHGELLNKDSIHIEDTIKYVTRGGKILYGGGGIMPDIFIPLDTSYFSNFYLEARNKGLINKFSIQYADKHRNVLSKFKNYKEFLSYFNKVDIIKEFLNFAKTERINPSSKDIEKSYKILKYQLIALIARNIIDNEGYYPIIHNIDNVVIEAIKILEKN